MATDSVLRPGELKDVLLKEIEAAGVQVVGVSPDKVEVLKKFSDQAELGFPLLSDEGSKAIRAFGILHQRGLPHPGTILIDKQGVIRAKIFREGYRKRHPPTELIEAAKKLGK